MHVTLRVLTGVPSLRFDAAFARVDAALHAVRGRATRHRGAFRIAHFSVQRDHVHLLVEADDKHALADGVRALAIRIARAVNAARHRTGRVFERYHARALRTPSEVRNAIAYVLLNARKHLRSYADIRRAGGTLADVVGLDSRSSAPWFAGWRGAHAPALPLDDDAPVTAPRTWLLRIGWSRAGPVHIES